jgi:hypothetical protein
MDRLVEMLERTPRRPPRRLCARPLFGEYHPRVLKSRWMSTC